MFQWIGNYFNLQYKPPKTVLPVGEQYKQLVLTYPRVQVKRGNGQDVEYYRIVRADSAGLWAVAEESLLDPAFMAIAAMLYDTKGVIHATRVYTVKVKILPITEIDAQPCEVTRGELVDVILDLLNCCELNMDDMEPETSKLITRSWQLLEDVGYPVKAPNV